MPDKYWWEKKHYFPRRNDVIELDMYDGKHRSCLQYAKQ